MVRDLESELVEKEKEERERQMETRLELLFFPIFAKVRKKNNDSPSPHNNIARWKIHKLPPLREHADAYCW